MLAIGVMTTLVACGGSDGTAAGLVVSIDTQGLGRVQGFTLRTQAGELVEFDIDRGTEITGGAWPPEHLREHMATAAGVAVEYRQDDGRRVVIRLADAPWVGR